MGQDSYFSKYNTGLPPDGPFVPVQTNPEIGPVVAAETFLVLDANLGRNSGMS